MNEQYRQGDVLMIKSAAPLPRDLTKRDDLTVAYGEATGHRHRFNDESAVALYDAPDGDIFAEVTSDTALVHEEHEAIAVTPGIYRIRRQREYTPGEIKRVQD